MSNQCEHVNCLSFNLQDKWCTDCGAAYIMGNPALNPCRRWRSPEIAKLEGAGLPPPTPTIDWQARLEGVENFVRRIETQWEKRFTKHQLAAQQFQCKMETCCEALKLRVEKLEGDERENSAVAMHGHDDRINQLSDRVQYLQDIIRNADIDARVMHLEGRLADALQGNHATRTRIEKLYSTFEAVIKACNSVSEKSANGD